MVMKNFLFSALLLLILFASDTKAQNGIVKTYFDDGAIESELSYVNDILDGMSVFYYKSGNVKEEIPFSLGRITGSRKNYYPSGLLKEERNYNYGVLDGLTKIYFDNGALSEALNYDNGMLIKKITVPYDSTYTPTIKDYLAGNRQYTLSKEANIISDADITPVPLGGMEEIQDNLVIPERGIDANNQGTVTLSVLIDSLGNAKDPQIVKSLNKPCDSAAVEAVLKTKFLPGKKNAKIVSAKVLLNVDFKPEKNVAALTQNAEPVKQLALPSERKEENKIIDLAKKEKDSLTVTLKEIPKEEPKPVVKQEVTPADDSFNTGNYPVIGINSAEIEKYPYPVGGVERIIARMKLPEKSTDSKAEGDVIFRVEVDMFGVVRGTKLVKGISGAIDNAVEMAIIDSPFRPAKEEGKAVRGIVILKIPVKSVK